MANVKITDLTEDTTPADGDWVETVDISASSSKKVTRQNFLANLSTVTTSLANPYKFMARLSSGAPATGNNAFGSAVNFNSEDYDTNTNLASGVYTAPVTGFYYFSWATSVGSSSSGQGTTSSVFKNGTRNSDGSWSYASAGGQIIGTSGSVILSLTAGDTVDVRVFATTILNVTVAADSTWFCGFLVSRT